MKMSDNIIKKLENIGKHFENMSNDDYLKLHKESLLDISEFDYEYYNNIIISKLSETVEKCLQEYLDLNLVKIDETFHKKLFNDSNKEEYYHGDKLILTTDIIYKNNVVDIFVEKHYDGVYMIDINCVIDKE
jgi:hypothetical protein